MCFMRCRGVEGEAPRAREGRRRGPSRMPALVIGIQRPVPPSLRGAAIRVTTLPLVLAAALATLALPLRSQQAAAPAPLQHVADVGERLRALAAAHPDRARLEQVGRPLSGREIVALRVGPTEGEPPGVLLVAGLDGRRLGDVDALLAVAEALLADLPPGAPDRLAEAAITVLPLANPDGAAAL